MINLFCSFLGDNQAFERTEPIFLIDFLIFTFLKCRLDLILEIGFEAKGELQLLTEGLCWSPYLLIWCH